jgi:hypothetical protein
MTYGFKFYNDLGQVVIDDTSVKPWYIADAYVGRNYTNTDVSGLFEQITGINANSYPSNSITGTAERWRVYEIKYVAPNNADCFAVFTLPDSSTVDIWYAAASGPITLQSQNGASWNAITLDGVFIGYYPIFSIYAMVPQSWLDTAPNAAQIAAVIPKVYYYTGNNIPNGSLGLGYGAQVFNSVGQATYDSGKYHLQVASSSFPIIRLANPNGTFGPEQNGGTIFSTTGGYPATSANNIAFTLPIIAQKSYYLNSNDSAAAYLYESRMFFKRVLVPDSANATIKTRNPQTIIYNVLRSSYPGVANGTNFNYGLRTIRNTNWYFDILYADLFIVDGAPLDRGYSTTNFPSGYVLTGNATDAFEFVNIGNTPNYRGVITLTTYNVAAGTVVPYTITGTGITTSDFSAMYKQGSSIPISLTGSFTVNANTASFTFDLAGDTVLEGTETLTLALNNGLASITFQIKEQKVYALSWVNAYADGYKFNEGSTATARLTTNNVTNGTQVAYSLSPYTGNTQPNSADFSNAALTGNFTVNTGGATNSNGTADISFVITNDLQTEGAEGFLLKLPVVDPTSGLSLAGEITDTSRPAPVYTILNPTGGTTGRVDLNEGTTYTFSVQTTNVNTGTILYPNFAAPLTVDVNTDFSASWYNNVLGVNSGVAVNSSGLASFSFTVVADSSTETEEYFTLRITDSLGNVLVSYPSLVYIQDTSQDPVEIYTVSANYDNTLAGGASEGNIVTFDMTAAEDYGHSVFWTLEGTNFNVADIQSMVYINPNYQDEGGPYSQAIAVSLQGTFTFPALLEKQLRVTLKNDTSTEGPETMTLKLRQTSYTSAARASVSVYIKDTSRAPVNETITAPTNTALAGELNITWAGGYADDIVYYEIDATPVVGTSPSFQLDGTGFANNPTAGAGIAPGTYTLYCYFLGSGNTRTFVFTIMPNYSITPNVTSVDENGSVTWTVKAPVTNGTLLYWTNTGTTDAADFNDAYGNVNIGSVSITSYTGQITRTLRTDSITEGAQTIIMRLDSGGNNQNLRATAATVTVNDTSQPVLSTDATLSALAVSNSSLSPAFSSSTVGYTVTVANSITSYTVTPTVNQANATIKVNGSTVTSGSASQAIGLGVGDNPIYVVVTAQDGTTTKTYTVIVTRPGSTPTYAVQANTTSISEGGTPVTYTVTTTNLPSGTVVYWTNLGSAGADDFITFTNSGSVTINASGTGTFTRTARADSATDAAGEYEWIFLYSDSGYSTWTGAYAAQVYINDTSQTPAQSTDATLSALSISAGTLSPAFSNTTIQYTASVSNATSFINVTPTVNHPNASVTVAGTPTTSGTAESVYLSVGSNSILVTVTAQSGLTKTYTITVTRAAAATYAQTLTVSPTSWAFGSTTVVTLDGAVPSSTFNYGIDDPTCATYGDQFNTNGYWQNTSAFAGQAAGTYTLYVKFNATGVVRSTTITITAPATVSVSNYSLASTGVPDSTYYEVTASPNKTYDAIKIKALNTYNFDYSVTRTFTVSQACTITCYLTVSTEYNYDYGHIFVDGTPMYENTWPVVNTTTTAGNGTGAGGQTGLVPANGLSGSYGTDRVGASGYVASGAMTRSLAAGTHTVKIRYMADYSLNGTFGTVLGEWSIS